MFMYAIYINYQERIIVVDERATQTQYVFTEGGNPYEHSISLHCNEYPFDDVVQIDEPTYETDTNPIKAGCPYDIWDFDAFASGLRETFGRRRQTFVPSPTALTFLRICRKARLKGFNALENCWGEVCTRIPNRPMYCWAVNEADRLGLFDLNCPETIEDLEFHGVNATFNEWHPAPTRREIKRKGYHPISR